ncbi:MAG: DNA-binding protein [Methanosarcinaceae archaeon]|nr:DNA-binding protein [Methanosarcinaceae archaeon]MDD4498245.1 DNA-binding protein [Methanosarcinaceae archaeon]
MEYSKGKIGRVFTVRVDHGEDLLGELGKLAELERIESAVFVLLGALKKGGLVVGPKEDLRPPCPVWFGFDEAREVLGIGNLFQEDGKPKFHLHTGTGRGETVKLGCLRGESEVFMVAEVFIFEIEGISARRIMDPEQGFAPIRFN